MSGRRFVIPTPVKVDRQAVDSTNHVVVDAALKDLKTASRQLTEALTALKIELRLLERIYYKGKNQHRLALFWRRVPELRRFGCRVAEGRMETMVQELRLSFFPPEARQMPKILRGSWSSVPEASFLRTLSCRNTAMVGLLKTGRERCQNAFRIFALAMGSGAFLQLLLTLTAIAARFGELYAELEVILNDCIRVCESLSIDLFAPERKTGQPLVVDPLQRASVLDQIVDGTLGSQDDEDVGRSVQRDRDTPLHSEVSHDHYLDTLIASSLGKSEVVDAIAPLPRLNQRSTARDTKTKNAKKRKRKDEIDEIFGF